MSVSEFELTSAKKLGKFQLMKRIYPDYKLGIKDSCLTEILTKRDTGKCTTNMQIQNTLWIQLHTNQDWIGIASKKELLHIICSDKVPRNVRVYQNFILHLEPDCTVISDTTLRPDNLLKDKIEFHKTIRLIDQNSINETLSKYRLTDIPMDIIKETHIDPERLQTFRQNFKRIRHSRKNINTQKSNYVETKIYVLFTIGRIRSAWLCLFLYFFIKLDYFRAL